MKTFESVELNKFELVLLVALMGVICGLIMPGFAPMGFLAWIALVPLFIALKRTKTIFQSMLLTFVFGTCFNAITILWIMSIWSFDWAGVPDVLTGFMSVGIWVVISLWCGLFFGLWGGLTKVVLNSSGPRIVKNIFIALFWVLCINKLMSVGELAFPWAQIEYTQFRYLTLIQAASLINGVGIAFLIVFINAHIAFCVFAHRKEDNAVAFFPKQVILPFIIFVLLFGYGFWTIKTPNKVLNKNITISQLDVNSDKNDKTFFQLYKNQLSVAPAGLIVFPEVGNSNMLSNTNGELISTLKEVSLENKTIITGIRGRKFDKKYNKYLNSNDMIVFSNKTEQYYTKRFLVPFGEFIPKYAVPKILETTFFDKFLPYPLIRGAESIVWDTDFGKIAPSICYEIMFPTIFKEQAKMGAELFVNVSNLQWFTSSILQDQFWAAAIFRAIENRRIVLSGMKGGRSFIINQKGQTLLRPDFFKAMLMFEKV